MPTYLPARVGVSQSQALAEAYAHARAGEPELLTIALYHPSFRNESGDEVAIYLVNGFEPLSATLEADAHLDGGQTVEFVPVPFTFVRPEETDGGVPPEVTVAIDNVSGHITPYLLAATKSQEPVELVARVYLASDTSAPHETPVLRLILRSATVDAVTVQARAGYGDLVNRKFPRGLYERRTHAALMAG